MKTTQSKKSRPKGPFRFVSGQVWIGALIILVTFGGLGGWAAVAPLASAAIGAGAVGVSSRRQTIQHLEGGIIKELLVRDGDKVQAGDLLVRLDETKPSSLYEVARSQYLATLAERARLEAERDEKPAISWPAELVPSEEGVEALMLGQTNVFKSRRDYLSGQHAILIDRRLQLEKQIEGFKAQLVAETRKRELIDQEEKVVDDLVKRGLDKMPRLLGLQRTAAEMDGNKGNLVARMAQTEQQISELVAQYNDTKNKMMSESVTQLRDAEVKIAEYVQKMRAAKDALSRIDIRAPRNGYIVNLQYFTVGGVIDSGKPILDLVPDDDKLVIETRFEPRDIDVIKIGLPAEVTLTPYSSRAVPPLKGTLITLSADALLDQKAGTTFYAGRVEVDPDELRHLSGVKLVPGMPAQVMVRTGERTALQYFIDPFRKSINRAFREK